MKNSFFMKYFNFKLSLKLGWPRTRDLSKIKNLSGHRGFELRTLYIQCSYLTHGDIKLYSLGGLGVPVFTSSRQVNRICNP